MLEKLEAAGFAVAAMPGSGRFLLIARGDYAALVEKTADGLKAPGPAGKMTPDGLAQLVWRGQEARLVVRKHESPASAEGVAGLRSFAADLSAALA